MFCEKCGSVIEDGSTFCMSCGAQIESAEEISIPQSAPAIQTRQNKLIIWLIPILFAVLPIVFSVYILITGGFIKYEVDVVSSDSSTVVSSTDVSSLAGSYKTNLSSIRYTAAASSYLNTENKYTNKYIYYPQDACDGNQNTAWIEGVDGPGVGEWIRLDFDDKYEISGISIINGWAKNSKTYYNESRVARILVEADGFKTEASLEDNNLSYQTVDFGKKVVTSYVKITILDTYRGDDDLYTAISEIKVI